MPLAARAPPALAVNPKVTGTAVLPATRSAAGITKDEEVTAPPMIPDATATERVVSTLVDTFTSPDARATPMVKPESVIVAAAEFATVPPEIVITVEVAPEGTVAGVNVSPAALDGVIVPVVVVVKKPEG